MSVVSKWLEAHDRYAATYNGLERLASVLNYLNGGGRKSGRAALLELLKRR